MFIETPRFPKHISAGSRFGPGYSTSHARNFGGYRFSNQNWAMPLYEGDVAQAVKTQEQLDELLAFFHGAAGMHNGFRYWNPNDYTATGTQGTLVQLTSTTWQMHKSYTLGAVTRSRKISKPVSGTITVSGGGGYSIDYTTGIITKTSGADPTAWTGEYDFPVQFNVDRFLPESINIDLYRPETLPIIELRL